MTTKDQGHAFISYVREDAARVDRLQKILDAAGVKVWRDTSDLWPGEDWRGRIRDAITKNALAFIACFSTASEARQTSGQNEELTLAIDQLRLRRPDQPWLIPVRFDEVSIPDIEVGAGRTLNSIQRVDLTGDSWDEGAASLVAAVLRALDKPVDVTALRTPTANLDSQIKSALRDSNGDIALSEILLPIASEVRTALSDEERFPSSSDALQGAPHDAANFVVDLVDRYIEILDPALDALVVAAQWARVEHTRILTQFTERLFPTWVDGSGMTVLTELRWFPVVPVEYVGSLAALHQRNYAALKAVVIDATVRDRDAGRIPLIARGNPRHSFSQFDLPPQILAFRASGEEVSREVSEALDSGRKGKRYTPVSDYIHDTLRPKFQQEIPDDTDYSELFDELEILLALLAIDAAKHRVDQRAYFNRPYVGRFTWRDRLFEPENGVDGRLHQGLIQLGAEWPPLEAGLFGGSVERASAAFEAFAPLATEARQRRF